MNNTINSKVIDKKLGFTLSYVSKEALTSRVAIEYDKAGFKVEEATISAYCSQIDLAEDRAYVNNISIPVLYGSNTKFTASENDTKFEMTLSMIEHESERNITFSCGQGVFKAIESDAYVDRATFSGSSKPLKYTNNTEAALMVTHGTIIRQNTNGKDTSVIYLNNTDNADILGKIIYPGETIEFYNSAIGSTRCNVFLVLKQVYIANTYSKTKRQITHRKIKKYSSKRTVSLDYAVRIRGVKRLVANTSQALIRHTRRYVAKRYNKVHKTTRKVTIQHNTKLKPTTKRIIVSSIFLRIRGTKRLVAKASQTRIRQTRRYVSKNAKRTLKSLRQVTIEHNTKLKPMTKRIVIASIMVRIRGLKRKTAISLENLIRYTKRAISKDINRSYNSYRQVVLEHNTRFRPKTNRIIIKSIINRVRHTKRYVSKDANISLETNRQIALKHNTRLKPKTTRIVVNSKMVRIRGVKRKVAVLAEARVRHTRRYVHKAYNKLIDTARDISFNFETRVRSKTSRIIIKRHTTRLTRVFRKVAINTEALVRHTRRNISKRYTKKLDTDRDIIHQFERRFKFKTNRIIVAKTNNKYRTKRRVIHGPQSSTIWLDTKLITLNTIKSKGPLLRKTSNNASTSIPQTLRPIVWVYKLNDGHPIDLDTSRTIHKSINNNINTLRRVDHDFYYTTTLSTSRSTSSSSNSSIDSIRQVLKETSSKINSKRQLIKNYNLYSDTLRASSIYTNGSILTIRTTSLSNNLNIISNRQVIDYGHCKLKSIRRISKDNCICCNALTNRKVINDFLTAFNTIRTATTTNEANINTNRLIAINYISGYAFTNRHITAKDINSIDLYRHTTNMANPELDALRKITVYDWFYNPTTRYITNEANRSYLTSRKAVSDIFVSQDTSRSICNKTELNLDNNREIVKSIERDIDVKRSVAGEISKKIDVTKKVVEKYIYLNKGQRQIIKSIKQDIDSYRETNKLLIANIDTIREVKSENIADTLCIDFIFKHGNLYEIDRSFYKAK